MRRINIDKTTKIENISIPSKVEPSFQITKNGGITINDGITINKNTGTSIVVGIDNDGNHGIYSKSNERWILYADDSNTIKTPSQLVIAGHSSPIGSYINGWLAANKNASAGTSEFTPLCSISLDAGVWLITAGVRWPSNSTGYRMANISTTQGSPETNISCSPVSGAVTQIRFEQIVYPDSTTTYYLNAGHTASSTPLVMPASGSGYGNFLRAVRIR